MWVYLLYIGWIIAIVVHGEAKAVKDEHKGKRPVDPYGFDLFKSGHIPQPKNPYFVTKIRAKRRDELVFFYSSNLSLLNIGTSQNYYFVANFDTYVKFFFSPSFWVHCNKILLMINAVCSG